MPKQKKPRRAQPNPGRREWAEAQLKEKRRYLQSIEGSDTSAETLEKAREDVRSWEKIVWTWVD